MAKGRACLFPPLRSLVRMKRLTSRRRIPDDHYAKLIFHADVDPA